MSWFTAPCYKNYWENYSRSMKWLEDNIAQNSKQCDGNCNCHFEPLKTDGEQFKDELEFDSDSDGISPEYLEFLRQTEEHKRQREEYKKGPRKTQTEDSVDDVANYASPTCLEIEELEEEEDDDGSEDVVDYLPIEKLSIAAASGTLLASSSHDLKKSKADSRRAAAALLFGENDKQLGKLFALETALQSDFDYFIDSRKPRVWPVCPFNASVLGLN